MRADGVVRTWHTHEGWGVVDSPGTPGGCWAHFSAVLVPGHRELVAGQRVTLDYEVAAQDGYRFRAIEVWPAGPRPEVSDDVTEGPSEAYRSSLSLETDE